MKYDPVICMLVEDGVRTNDANYFSGMVNEFKKEVNNIAKNYKDAASAAKLINEVYTRKTGEMNNILNSINRDFKDATEKMRKFTYEALY